jgi:hypothetical protein
MAASLLYNAHAYITHRLPIPCTLLKRVILRGDLDVEVAAENRDLLHNVFTHARYLGEEEEGEEAGNAAEATEKGTAWGRVSLWSRGIWEWRTYVFMRVRAVMPW